MTKSAKIISFALTIIMVLSVACSMMIQSTAAAAPTIEIKQISVSGDELKVSINLVSGSFNAIDIQFETKGLTCTAIGKGSAISKLKDPAFSSNPNASGSASNISFAVADGFKEVDEWGTFTGKNVTGSIASAMFKITNKNNYSFKIKVTECVGADGKVTPVIKGTVAYSSTSSSTSKTTYTVTYNANGGKGAPSAQKVEANTSVKLSNTKPTRSGYTFLGWSKDKNATSATYSAGASVKISANTTLYAVWKKNATPATTYILTYNANGGSNAPSAQKAEANTSFKLSSTKPTRSGYTFLGWSKDKNATSATYSAGASVKISANTTLYAIWKANTNNNEPSKTDVQIPTATLPSDITSTTTTTTTTFVAEDTSSSTSDTTYDFDVYDNTQDYDYNNDYTDSNDVNSNEVLEENDNKKIIIIVAAIAAVLVAGAVVAFVFINKKKNQDNF